MNEYSVSYSISIIPMISVSYGMSIIAITQYDTDIIGINAMILMTYRWLYCMLYANNL